MIILKTTQNFYTPFKIGLLVVVFTFFMFTLYGIVTLEWIGEWEGLEASTSFWIFITDMSSLVGLVFRFIGSLIAFVGYSYYFFNKGLSTNMTNKVLKIVLVCEAIYWFSFITSGIWGATPILDSILGDQFNIYSISFILSTGIPCLFEAIFLPIALVKIMINLSKTEAKNKVIKWALIAGTGYIFVWWLNNAGLWINAVIIKGTQYLTSYPVNLFSFISTLFGLPVLGIIAIYFTKKSIGTSRIELLNLRIVGAIITFAGLYFLWNYIAGIVYGTELWSVWYAWLLGHNLDLWALSLPTLGISLLVRKKMKLNIKQKNGLVYFAQAIGITFIFLFLTAYFGGRLFGGLSSIMTLNNDPNFILLQSITGILFIGFVIALLIIDVLTKQKTIRH